MIFLLDDDRAYDKYKKKSRFFSLSQNDGFRVTEVDTIAKQHPCGRDISAFYVMHYMSRIINSTKHKQVLIIPTLKSLLIKFNNALHVTILQWYLLVVCDAIRYKGVDHSRHRRFKNAWLLLSSMRPHMETARCVNYRLWFLIINNSLNPASLYTSYYVQRIIYCQKYSCM